jgi:hypothetical protein
MSKLYERTIVCRDPHRAPRLYIRMGDEELNTGQKNALVKSVCSMEKVEDG